MHQTRRHDLRKDVVIEAVLQVGGSETPAYITSLSTGGAFVSGSSDRPLGETVTLTFIVPGERLLIRAEATIRWRVPQMGHGVAFVELRPLEQAALARFLARVDDDLPESAVAPSAGGVVAHVMSEGESAPTRPLRVG
jgi:PilZ domain-containing protein